MPPEVTAGTNCNEVVWERHNHSCHSCTSLYFLIEVLDLAVLADRVAAMKGKVHWKT